MAQPRMERVWSVSTFLSALTSLICMGSMGAMTAVATASAAAAGSMAGMNSEATVSTPAHIAFTTQLLQNVGLGVLIQIPDPVLRPIFILLLIIGLVGSFLTFRAHRRMTTLVVVFIASSLLYTSIYVFPSDLLYYASLVMLLIGTIWNMRVRPRSISDCHSRLAN